MLSAALTSQQEPKVPPGTHLGQPSPSFPHIWAQRKVSSRCVAEAHGGTFESLASRLRPVRAGSVQRLACLLQKKLVTVTLVLVWPLSLEILHGVY